MSFFNEDGLGRKLLNSFVAIALYAMVALVFINVVLRYCFNSGLPVSEELSRWLFVWVSVFGAIVALKEGKHVGVSLLIDHLKPETRKIFIIVGDSVVLAVLAVLVWGSCLYLMNNYNVPASASHLPTGILSGSLVICSVSMFIISFIKLLKDLKMKTQDFSTEISSDSACKEDGGKK